MRIKEAPSHDPMFVVTVISKGYYDKEFPYEMPTSNNEIETDLLTTNIIVKIKIIGKRQYRNP